MTCTSNGNAAVKGSAACRAHVAIKRRGQHLQGRDASPAVAIRVAHIQMRGGSQLKLAAGDIHPQKAGVERKSEVRCVDGARQVEAIAANEKRRCRQAAQQVDAKRKAAAGFRGKVHRDGRGAAGAEQRPIGQLRQIERLAVNDPVAASVSCQTNSVVLAVVTVPVAAANPSLVAAAPALARYCSAGTITALFSKSLKCRICPRVGDGRRPLVAQSPSAQRSKRFHAAGPSVKLLQAVTNRRLLIARQDGKQAAFFQRFEEQPPDSCPLLKPQLQTLCKARRRVFRASGMNIGIRWS